MSQEREYSVSCFANFKIYESEKKVESKSDSQMRGGQPGPQPAKSAGPTAKLRASDPRARSKKRPAYYYINKLISPKPEFRYDLNFTGVV